MLSSSILYTKISYNCLGVVKPVLIFTTREQVIQWLINDIGMKNGEIRIKVQNGKFVLIEMEGRMRADSEGIEVLERVKF